MNTSQKITVRTLHDYKSRGEKFLMLTAYDACTAHWAEAAGVPTILVGDSMGNTVLGYPNTLPVTLEESLLHTSAVRRGAPNAFVVGDMPFMSYQVSVEEAVRNAGRYLKECGADAVKLEGGRTMLPVIERLVTVGIPVVGHIGLLPQSVLKDGGYRLHGKADDEANALIADARALDAAGVCAMVLEGIPRELAATITCQVSAPTIGIAAGAGTDGQVQVIADLLGLNADGFTPRHAKRYAEVGETAIAAIRQYVSEVQSGIFPDEAHSAGAKAKS
ncbi:MAG: 3-methyl-2-oxobutanoate hydroxymethyltransferase [Victivallales bacterium]|nr:3-methyl-2-oxobutanoate hydroxymethyltransferase [Victivallales bacterium]